MFAVEITTDFKSQNFSNNIKAMKGAVDAAEKAALEAAPPELLKMAQATVATWSNKPHFTVKRIKGANGWRSELWVNDERWTWLDQGTKVRYATMQQGFIAKTKVGVMYSYAGKGKVAFVSKKKPMPGIAARGWTQLMVQRVGPIIRRTYQDEFHKRWTND